MALETRFITVTAHGGLHMDLAFAVSLRWCEVNTGLGGLPTENLTLFEGSRIRRLWEGGFESYDTTFAHIMLSCPLC